MVKIDRESFKKAGYSFEEINQIIESEEDLKNTGITYGINDTFEYVKNKLFTKSTKCIK